jgi:polyhydroxybutyrate depolymerase
MMVATCAIVSMACDRSRGEKAKGLTERSVQVEGEERAYQLHVPKGWDGQTALPLVMMLHGGGATGAIAMEETRWAETADAESFLAVFPTATTPDPNRPPRFSTNPPGWNDGSGRLHAGKRGEGS